MAIDGGGASTTAEPAASIPAEEVGERTDVAGPEEARRRRPVVGDDAVPGRRAATPADIPWPGWRAVLRRVADEAVSDQVGAAAASCGFYALLALFPSISVLVSLYGLVADPALVEARLEPLRGVLPATTYELIAGRVHDLATAGGAKLGWGLLLSLPLALWSAMAATKAVLAALNVAYEERERRSFLLYNLEALLFTLAGILGVAFALTVIVAVPVVLKFAWLGPLADLAVRAISFLLLLGFVVLALSLLYRFGPSRADARWRWITPGAILATALWLVASLLFSAYVANFGSYDATYGSLGAVAVALLWFWLSAYAVILGAELNAELELQTERDTTTGPERPIGRRGAFVADHVVRPGRTA